MTNLAKFIKAKRKEFGLTQVYLSQKSGVGLRFVREMEQGKDPPDWIKSIRFLHCLGRKWHQVKSLKINKGNINI